MPIIFMEWVNLPNNPEACPEFREWVTNFYQAGYIPTNTREYNEQYLQKDILTKIPLCRGHNSDHWWVFKRRHAGHCLGPPLCARGQYTLKWTDSLQATCQKWETISKFTPTNSYKKRIQRNMDWNMNHKTTEKFGSCQHHSPFHYYICCTIVKPLIL